VIVKRNDDDDRLFFSLFGIKLINVD